MTVCTAYYHGRRTTPRCAQGLWVLNQILQNGHGEKSDMSMMQGSCSTSVGASAGTHAGGDAGDLSAFNQYNRVKFGRLIGFNIHYRTALRNVWAAHIHFTMLKSSTVSSSAQSQNNVWYARYGNGLANGGKATGFLPNSKEIKFIRRDESNWIANKNTTGYAQPGSDSKGPREKGWTFQSIGVVEVAGKRYLLTATPTFYPLNDFNELVDDFKGEDTTWQVVKATQGYEKMWSEKTPNTLRQPGYIIKSVGHSTKGNFGVVTENGTWYRSGDMKKIDNKYSNTNPPPSTTPTPPKEPVPPVVEAPGDAGPDANTYEVTANPSLYGLEKPGLGNVKKDLLPKGTRFTAIQYQTVAGDKWIQAQDTFWYHSHYLKKVVFVQQPDDEIVLAPEPEVAVSPPEDVEIEAFNGDWRVIVDSKWGTVGPEGDNLYERGKDYHLFTTQKAIHNDTVYYITAYGTWYSSEGLLPWSVPEVLEPDSVLPEPTPEAPVTVPVPAPKPAAEKMLIRAGTQNIMVRRLGPKPTGSQPFSYGASYPDRMKILAKQVKSVGLDILATQEAGAYKDRDTLNEALGNWGGILHGDNGDITQSVHWNKDVYTLKKEGTIASYGSTHNKHTYVKLEHKATRKPLWVVSVHLRYGPDMVNHRIRQIKDIVEGAWKLAGNDPILFLGDFNNNSKDKDAVTKNMAKNGYNAVSSKFTSMKDTLNHFDVNVSKATQIYDNGYWHKSRKIVKAGVTAPMSAGKYIKPFISDHNMAWAYLEA